MIDDVAVEERAMQLYANDRKPGGYAQRALRHWWKCLNEKPRNHYLALARRELEQEARDGK